MKTFIPNSVLNKNKMEQSVKLWRKAVMLSPTPPVAMQYAAESVLCWHSGWQTGNGSFEYKSQINVFILDTEDATFKL